MEHEQTGVQKLCFQTILLITSEVLGTVCLSNSFVSFRKLTDLHIMLSKQTLVRRLIKYPLWLVQSGLLDHEQTELQKVKALKIVNPEESKLDQSTDSDQDEVAEKELSNRKPLEKQRSSNPLPRKTISTLIVHVFVEMYMDFKTQAQEQGRVSGFFWTTVVISSHKIFSQFLSIIFNQSQELAWSFSLHLLKDL